MTTFPEEMRAGLNYGAHALPEEARAGFNYSALANLLMHGDELAIMALRKHMAAKSADPHGEGRDAAAVNLGLSAGQSEKLANATHGQRT